MVKRRAGTSMELPGYWLEDDSASILNRHNSFMAKTMIVADSSSIPALTLVHLFRSSMLGGVKRNKRLV